MEYEGAGYAFRIATQKRPIVDAPGRYNISDTMISCHGTPVYLIDSENAKHVRAESHNSPIKVDEQGQICVGLGFVCQIHGETSPSS